MSDLWFTEEKGTSRTAPNLIPGDTTKISHEDLRPLGICSLRFNAADLQSEKVDTFIEYMKAIMGYTTHNILLISPEALGGEEEFERVAAEHFTEHLHEIDTVRVMLDGEAYLDVRSTEDRWIRIHLTAGDALFVPAGMYHRFTTTDTKHTTVLCLLAENHEGTAVGRLDGESLSCRRAYRKFLASPLQTVVGPALGAENHIYMSYRTSALDTTLNEVAVALVNAAHASNAPGVAVLYITGSVTPFTNNESWCPDCVAVKQLVRESFERILAKHTADLTAFVELPVERTAYLGNPQHPYRLHPVLQLTSVPTVLVLTTKPGAKAGDSWLDAMEVKKRGSDATTIE